MAIHSEGVRKLQDLLRFGLCGSVGVEPLTDRGLPDIEPASQFGLGETSVGQGSPQAFSESCELFTQGMATSSSSLDLRSGHTCCGETDGFEAYASERTRPEVTVWRNVAQSVARDSRSKPDRPRPRATMRGTGGWG